MSKCPKCGETLPSSEVAGRPGNTALLAAVVACFIWFLLVYQRTWSVNQSVDAVFAEVRQMNQEVRNLSNEVAALKKSETPPIKPAAAP